MSLSRRSVLRTAAWSAPVVTLATAAPAFATSPIRKDPGINGWVLVSYGTDYGFDATFDSNPQPAPSTPDGAAFGLYLYDTVVGDVFKLASVTYWFRGKPEKVTRTGSGWSSGTYVGTETKSDGLTYHGYRFVYSGPFTRTEPLVRLDNLKVTAEEVASGDATFWVERHITINNVAYGFERRNGERGPLGNGFPSARRSISGKASASAGVMV